MKLSKSLLFLGLFILSSFSAYGLTWKIKGENGEILKSGVYDLGDRRNVTVTDATIEIFHKNNIYFDYNADDFFSYILNLDVPYCFQVKEQGKLRSDLKGMELPSKVILENSNDLEWVHYFQFEYDLDSM